MALTIADWQRCTLKNKLLCFTTITGDATGTATVDVPMSRIDAAWVAPSAPTATVESAGWGVDLTWSGQTITYGSAPSNNKKHQLFVLGSD